MRPLVRAETSLPNHSHNYKALRGNLETPLQISLTRVAKTNGGKVQRARETNMGPPEPYQRLKIKAQPPSATYDAQTEARKNPAQC